MIYQLNDEKWVRAHAAGDAPALTVKGGATVRIRTKDCYGNGLRAPQDPRGAATESGAVGNPATGPIWVEGAQPGDTLKVEVLDIEVDSYATMRISKRGGALAHRVEGDESYVRAWPLAGGRAQVAGVDVPLAPMIGVIGVAPAGQPVDTETPGRHGGNMDTRHILSGSCVYLPVFQPGALLALGDVHAQMGDGEVCVCGLECAAYVTVRVSVIPGRQERWPVVEQGGCFRVICSAATLDEAAHEAGDAMLDFLRARLALPVNDLILLMSLVCDLEVSQVVDPLVTARMALRPGVFPALSF